MCHICFIYSVLLPVSDSFEYSSKEHGWASVSLVRWNILLLCTQEWYSWLLLRLIPIFLRNWHTDSMALLLGGCVICLHQLLFHSVHSSAHFLALDVDSEYLVHFNSSSTDAEGHVNPETQIVNWRDRSELSLCLDCQNSKFIVKKNKLIVTREDWV